MALYINEILAEINANPTLLTTKYKRNPDPRIAWTPEGILLSAAFDPTKRLPLPSGEPPYKPSDIPIGLNPSSALAEASKFYVYFKENITNNKKQNMFIQSLEKVSAIEAKILIAVKDQKLSELYPNITAQLVADAGYMPQGSVPGYAGPNTKQVTARILESGSKPGAFTQEGSTVKRGRGRPKLTEEEKAGRLAAKKAEKEAKKQKASLGQ